MQKFVLNWVSAHGTFVASETNWALVVNGAFPRPDQSRDQELTDPRRELAQVKKGTDFLKRAAAYFGKESK